MTESSPIPGANDAVLMDGAIHANAPPSGPPVDWSGMVAKIQAGDAAGLEQLYKTFSRGLRYLLVRQVGPQEVEDKIHDIFLVVVNEIQKGNLREPERIMGFVRTIANRQIGRQIGTFVKTRHREVEIEPAMNLAAPEANPETQAMIREKAAIVRQALDQLSTARREILVRFYLREQPMEQICSEMKLTETQFRLHKSRAKILFGKIGQKHLAANRPSDSTVQKRDRVA